MSVTAPVDAATAGGSWAATRLGWQLRDEYGVLGGSLRELVALALRRGVVRSQLLVSTVLGKHLPTDPRIVRAAGLLLGRQVAHVLAGEATTHEAPTDKATTDFAAGELLRAALSGRAGAADAVLAHATAPLPDRLAVGPVAVIGYAETATALGHLVADALSGALYLHSTRRAVPGITALGGFEEEHSHATSHLLLPEDPSLFRDGRPVVLVDDELSTGQTVLNTIALLQRIAPRERYVVAALVDVRAPDDRARMAATAVDLGVRLDVVALATGTLVRPAGAATGVDLPPTTGSAAAPSEQPVRRRPGSLRRVVADWPVQVREGGRHGFTAADRPGLERALRRTAAQVAGPLASRRVLVLGCEELMYAPLRLAGLLLELPADVRPAAVRFSTTTRSPVLVVDEPGYPIRSQLCFPAHDIDPVGGPAASTERYAYNVGAYNVGAGNVSDDKGGADNIRAGIGGAHHVDGARTDRADDVDEVTGADHVLLVVDDLADTPALHASNGLLAQLRALGAPVTLLVLPSYRPPGRRPR